MESIEELRARLDEAEETLRAIRFGEIDALVVNTSAGERVYTLQSAETPYRLLLEQMSEGAACLAADHTVLQSNQRLADLLERSLSSVIGARVDDLFDPDAARVLDALLAAAADVETVRRADIRIATSGGIRDVTLSVAAIRGVDEAVWSLVATDVTQARAAVRALELAQAQLRAVFDHIPAALTLRDLSGRYLQVNRYAAAVAGEAAAEIVGTTVGDRFAPDTVGPVAELDRQVLESGEPREDELSRVWRPGDAERTFRTVRFPVTDEGGTVTGLGTISIEITAQKAAERDRERLLEQLQDAQRLARIGSFSLSTDPPGRIWSPEMYRIVGRDPELGPPSDVELLEYIHPEDRAAVQAAWGSMLEDSPGFELDCRIGAGPGPQRTLHIIGRPDPVHPGGYLGTGQDVTEIRDAEERFRSVFDYAPIGMVVLDERAVISDANAAFGELCGARAADLSGRAFTTLLDPEDRESLGQAITALAQEVELSLAAEVRVLDTAGAPVDVTIQGTRLSRRGRRAAILLQCQDVTARRRFEEQLQFLAEHDPLTGLFNRRRFEDEVDRQLAQAARYGRTGALAMVDVDNFKSVNDTLGHSAGDELIVAVSGVLAQRLRESDTLARLGGDEFAVFLPRVEREEALEVATALRHAVEAQVIVQPGDRRITVSVGIAMVDADRTGPASTDTLLVEADLALYDAKEAGRNRSAVYSEAGTGASGTRTRLTWAARVEQALSRDGFTLVAQPILDLRADEVTQHELLIRMRDEDGGLIAPAPFLQAAERIGLIGRVDEWVVGHAIGLLESQPELCLEVNLSGASLGNPALLRQIGDRIAASQINPEHIIFEITETAAIANLGDAQTFAHRLRRLGCRFALDDFGAGFGSFYYLKHLPFDYVKIDGEFVQHAASGQVDRVVIQAVVALARGLGKQTVGEYVTSATTQDLLRRLGVDYAQGFHVGRPVPVEEVIDAGRDEGHAQA